MNSLPLYWGGDRNFKDMSKLEQIKPKLSVWQVGLQTSDFFSLLIKSLKMFCN